MFYYIELTIIVSSACYTHCSSLQRKLYRLPTEQPYCLAINVFGTPKFTSLIISSVCSSSFDLPLPCGRPNFTPYIFRACSASRVLRLISSLSIWATRANIVFVTVEAMELSMLQKFSFNEYNVMPLSGVSCMTSSLCMVERAMRESSGLSVGHTCPTIKQKQSMNLK